MLQTRQAVMNCRTPKEARLLPLAQRSTSDYRRKWDASTTTSVSARVGSRLDFRDFPDPGSDEENLAIDSWTMIGTAEPARTPQGRTDP